MDESIREHTEKLLNKHEIKEIDLENKIKYVIDRMTKRMKVEPKNPYTKEKTSNPVIDFVYHRQSNLPWKIITLQKTRTPSGDELRFCYYILNYTLLEKKGKLGIKYGQFGLDIPIDDYKILMDKAKMKGLL